MNGFRNNRNYQNYQMKRNNRIWPILVGIIAVVLCVVFLKKEGYLGQIKSKVPTGPHEQVAKVNQGIAQVTQANKNLAKEQQYNNGDLDAKDGMITDKTLLKDQFSNVQDLYSFGKVYSVFVFSNSKADVPWLDHIKDARKDKLKVMTLYGKDVSEDQSPMIYNMFTRNHNVSKKSKNYNKQTGKDYPFVMLFQDGKITTVVTKPSEVNELFEIQKKAQKKVDKKENNYEIPDNGIGVPYPDWKKYLTDTGKAIKKTYDGITNQNSSSN